MHDISMVQIILVTLVAFLAGCDAVLDERMFYQIVKSTKDIVNFNMSL